MSRTDPLSPVPFAAGPADEVLLRARGLSKSVGDLEVLRSIDLTVRKGEVVTLIGPSGPGKTTMLRSLNGLETPDGGTLDLAGGPSIDFADPVRKRDRVALRDRSAMVFQQHNLFSHMMVLQNVIEGPVQVQKARKAEAVAAAETLLDRVGLREKRDVYPFQLAGGQQQRVGIVRALALKPSLLLFDESTSALDAELVGEVLTVIKELADEGWTKVVVTHELSFDRAVADRGAVHGRRRGRGACHPRQMFSNPQHARTRRFLDRILNPLHEDPTD